MTRSRAPLFALALAYFACYVPYSAITKALTSPAVAGAGAWSGLALVPITTLASTVSMVITLSALGWWRYARRADGTETTYCVPLNRAASILGGVVATAGLALGFGLAYPTTWELVGAGLLIVSIGVLWIGPQLGRSSRSLLAGTASAHRRRQRPRRARARSREQRGSAS